LSVAAIFGSLLFQPTRVIYAGIAVDPGGCEIMTVLEKDAQRVAQSRVHWKSDKNEDLDFP
jgi:hypothetical protein